MSASAVFAVGDRTVTICIPNVKPGIPTSVRVEWAPDQPSRLSDAEWKQYRAGRAHALAGIAAELGINVAVLEL